MYRSRTTKIIDFVLENNLQERWNCVGAQVLQPYMGEERLK